MEDSLKLKTVYEEAIKFLKTKVDDDILNKQLDYYKKNRPKSIEGIFKRMVFTLKNKQGYLNFIADVEDMRAILIGFKPNKVYKKYNDDWKKLFKAFKGKFGNSYKMDINNKRNAWVMYSKGVLSCAKFLSNFNSVDKFDAFVRSFFLNEFTIAALPMLLEKEIFGFGFPLACDFLKEIGYVKYGKPDVHLKDIFISLKLVESYDDYEVFKKIVEIGSLVNKEPVIVDKIFWLIGSGDFYKSGVNIGRQKSNFIKYVKPKLN